jgi:hypothetical protein
MDVAKKAQTQHVVFTSEKPNQILSISKTNPNLAQQFA